MTGEWPPEGLQVDHKDGNKLNNSWINLRLATPEQNSRNYGAQSNNELGIKGVYLIRGKYSAYIYYENKLHFLGSFDNAEEAQEIHKAKSLEIQKEFSFYSREKVMSNG